MLLIYSDIIFMVGNIIIKKYRDKLKHNSTNGKINAILYGEANSIAFRLSDDQWYSMEWF